MNAEIRVVAVDDVVAALNLERKLLLKLRDIARTDHSKVYRDFELSGLERALDVLHDTANSTGWNHEESE